MPSKRLETALRAGDAAAADAAFAAGERLPWESYADIFHDAQSRKSLPTLQWFDRKTGRSYAQKLLFTERFLGSGLNWVAINAKVFSLASDFTECARIVVDIAARAELLNEPVVKPSYSDQRMAVAARDGWRLLNFAAAEKNLTFIAHLLEQGAHPDGFDPAVLLVPKHKGRFAEWSWAEFSRRPPAATPALLCADSPQCLDALAQAGADLSIPGRVEGVNGPTTVMRRSLPAIREHWGAQRFDRSLALARFWLDRAQPQDLAHLANDRDLCPAEGMLRLKGLSALAERVFPEGSGGALDRLRFDLSPFERQRGRRCVEALRRRDFFALSSELRSAAAGGAPFDQWLIGGRHVFILALSYCAALPERERTETLYGAGVDRDQQAAALIDLALELGGSRAVFEPAPSEPGSLAHYCALGFGSAANEACARASKKRVGSPLRLVENPLNWALWSNNEAALSALALSGACDARFLALFPSSLHPMELALERGRLDVCKALADAGSGLDRPSSLAGKSLRDLILASLEDPKSAQDPRRAQALREILSASERSEIASDLPAIERPRPRL